MKYFLSTLHFPSACRQNIILTVASLFFAQGFLAQNFSELKEMPKELASPTFDNSFCIIGLGELDGENGVDVIYNDIVDTFTLSGVIRMQYNQSTGSDIAFSDPEELFPGNLRAPIISDLNNDGLNDMVLLDADNPRKPTIVYILNTGSTESAGFNYGNIDSVDLSANLDNLDEVPVLMPVFLELNGDENSDLLFFSTFWDSEDEEVKKTVYFFSNDGKDEEVSFSFEEVNPFGLELLLDDIDYDDFSSMTSIDADMDADDDIIITAFDATLLVLLQNTGNATHPEFNSFSTIAEVDVTEDYFLLPTAGDVDGDGDEDISVIYSSFDLFENVYVENLLISSTEKTFSQKESLHLYPNPVVDKLILEESALIHSGTICNMQGKQLRAVEDPAKTISVSDLQGGLYLLNIQLKNGEKTTLKFVKE